MPTLPALLKIALVVAAAAGAAAVVRFLLDRRDRDLDFAEPHTAHPERPIEEMERQADVPGGVRP